MKLHPFNDVFFVADSHYYPVAGHCGQFQRRGECRLFYYQRVVTTCLEWPRQVPVYRPAVMVDEGALTVCGNRGTDDLGAIGIPDTLVAQAYTEDWNGAGEAAYNIVGDSRIERGTGSWRDDNVGGAKALDLFQGYLVISVDQRFPSQFPQVLGEIINK